MKAKHKWVGVLLLLSSLSAMAYRSLPFPGWPELQEHSKDIVVVKCKRTRSPNPVIDGAEHNGRGLIDTDVEIVSVLKGSTNVSASVVRSAFWPRQDEYYLVFADYNYGCYQALERYRMVPLGLDFSTNNLTGKKLDEQVRGLLKYRLYNLNRQMSGDAEEKKRLEGF